MLVSLLTIAGSLTIMAEPSFGLGAPTIAFLNPSSFSMAGERGIILSDAAPDSGPGFEAASAGYRFSAWTANAPTGSRVFFSVRQSTIDIEIAASEMDTSTGSWEASWEIPDDILDGPAVVNAYLVFGEEAVAAVSQPVTIMRTQARAQVVYPEPGGSFGTYSALAQELPDNKVGVRGLPMGSVDAPYAYTPDLSYVRTFYTTTAPGAKPQWKACGTEVVGDTNNGYTDNGIRCTLANAGDQLAVTAIAAVPNSSPDDFEPRFNTAGDAVPVSSAYAQQLTTMSLVTDGSQQVAREEASGKFYCSTSETIMLQDQLGRQIAGANVDVHAAGPSDALAFNAPTFPFTAANQPPDRGAHTPEEAFDCTGQKFQGSTSPPGNANPGQQGEHSRFGLPDRKHIESVAVGTNDLGRFSFTLHSPVKGHTDWTAWIDEGDDGCLTNDDAFTQGELFVSGSIGWGEDPDSAVTDAYDLFVPCTSTDPGPTPEPTPTDDPGTKPDPSRSISLNLTGTPTLGRSARFTGRINGVRAACEKDQAVLLKMRRPGARFFTVAQGFTDAQGRFTLKAKARAPRDYRAVAPKGSGCNRAASQIIRLRTQ
jgi:hypothetical protein